MNSLASPLNLLLNPHTLQLGGPLGWVDVSAPECALLRAFCEAPNQRLDTPRMLEHVGKAADAAAKHALEVQIVRLRKKLELAGAPAPTIKVIRFTGYQLCVSVTMAGEMHPDPRAIFINAAL